MNDCSVNYSLVEFVNDGHLYTKFIDNELPADFCGDLYHSICEVKTENTTLKSELAISKMETTDLKAKADMLDEFMGMITNTACDNAELALVSEYYDKWKTAKELTDGR